MGMFDGRSNFELIEDFVEGVLGYVDAAAMRHRSSQFNRQGNEGERDRIGLSDFFEYHRIHRSSVVEIDFFNDRSDVFVFAEEKQRDAEKWMR